MALPLFTHHYPPSMIHHLLLFIFASTFSSVYFLLSSLLICPRIFVGGLLFRCMNCMTAYCEDCLPQDEIESIGRCRDLEALGYDSKQSYYIMCPSCCILDGVTARGVVGDQAPSESADKSSEDKEEEVTTSLQDIPTTNVTNSHFQPILSTYYPQQ